MKYQTIDDTFNRFIWLNKMLGHSWYKTKPFIENSIVFLDNQFKKV